MATVSGNVQFDQKVYSSTGVHQFCIVESVDENGIETDLIDAWAGQEFSSKSAAFRAVADDLGIDVAAVYEV